MRLLKVVGRLEDRAAAAGAEVGAIELVWSVDEHRVEAVDLQPGEYIAADITLLGSLGGTPVQRVVERITRDPNDLGNVHDAEGVRLGRVVSIEGSLVAWEVEEGPRPVDPVPPMAA